MDVGKLIWPLPKSSGCQHSSVALLAMVKRRAEWVDCCDYFAALGIDPTWEVAVVTEMFARSAKT